MDVTNPIIGGREVALPPGVARIGFRQLPHNGQARLKGDQGCGEIALCHVNVANFVGSDREAAPISGVVWIGGDQAGQQTHRFFGMRPFVRCFAQSRVVAPEYDPHFGLAVL